MQGAMSTTVRELGPYLALVLVGFLPNEIWRLLGIVIARGLDEDSELLVWVRAVATAVLAGVIAQLILLPPGALSGVPLLVRLGAVALGFLAFLAVRRSVFVGVLIGEIALIVGALLT
jgi:Branched-chain amino acid transport protein (AzlD)